MADLAVIIVAGIGALATVANGLGGYWLAGRNDEARDIRTAKREEAARAADHAKYLLERRHEWQRQVLLELQDELQKLARATAKILEQDSKTVRECGKILQLPEGLGHDDYLAATVAVQRLRSRTLVANLRTQVGDFVKFCADTSFTAIVKQKDDPPEKLTAFLDARRAQLGLRYENLVDLLGDHIRRNELG